MAGSIAQSVLTVRSTGATASLLLHKRSTVSKPPPLPGLARIQNSTTRSVTPALSHAVRVSSSTRINQVTCRVNRSGSAYSPLNSGSNFSDLPPTEMAPLFPGCDYERWLVLMDKPGGEGATKQQMIDCYIQTLAKVVGSEEEAKKRIYNVSSEMYFGFVCEIDEETSNNLEGLPGVLCVLPDSYVDPENKDCGGIQEQRHLIGLSSRPLASHDGFHLGCFPHKHPIQRKLKYGLPHETVFGSRTHQYPTLGSSNHKGEFCGTFNGSGSCRRGKFSRDVVVRSELTSAGSTGASYPLLEIWLNSKVRGICFYAVTACAAIILFVPMLLEHPFVLMFDRYRRQAHYLVAKTWAFLTVAPFVKIEYEGLENLPPTNTPAVYVANHQSFLDIYTLLTLGRSFKFISKTSIFLYPIIGWAMFLLGVIPLKRMDSRSQLDCLKQCMALIKKGASVFFFPEGTRSKDGKLGPFKKGAFSVAAKTGVPVIPITLIGTGEIMPAGMEGRLNPGSVKVIIHPSLVGNKPDALCNEARNIIAQDLIHQS